MCRFVGDGEAELADPASRFRPQAAVDHVGDMVLIGEARHIVVRLRLQDGPRNAPGGICPKQRQSAAMDEIVHQSGNENGLAGPGETGDAQPDIGTAEIGGAVG